MKARTLTVWMTGLLLSASFTSNAQNVPVATGRYTPDWDNLAQWECPEWFQNVKFGIWAHWIRRARGQTEIGMVVECISKVVETTIGM